MAEQTYKGYEIFKDSLGRLCIYNTKSQYDRDNDNTIVFGQTTEDARELIDQKVAEQN